MALDKENSVPTLTYVHFISFFFLKTPIFTYDFSDLSADRTKYARIEALKAFSLVNALKTLSVTWMELAKVNLYEFTLEPIFERWWYTEFEMKYEKK